MGRGVVGMRKEDHRHFARDALQGSANIVNLILLAI